MILLSTMDKDLFLVNVYGPNKDNPTFTKIFVTISKGTKITMF